MTTDIFGLVSTIFATVFLFIALVLYSYFCLLLLFSQHFKYFTSTLFLFAWVSKKSCAILVLYPLFFFCFGFQDFCLFLTFYNLKMVSLGVVLSAFILLGILWPSWICDLVSDTNLGKILSHYCFKYFFCPFLSSHSGIPIRPML